jgi:hypothetical protein
MLLRITFVGRQESAFNRSSSWITHHIHVAIIKPTPIKSRKTITKQSRIAWNGVSEYMMDHAMADAKGRSCGYGIRSSN